MKRPTKNDRFLQIHTLTAFPASLLNRDDAGFAKRMPFGGAVRTRISSQCLKRHWRTFDGPGSLSELKIPESIRSRETFEQKLVQPLINQGFEPDHARQVVQTIVDRVLGKSDKKKKAEVASKEKGAKKPKGDVEPIKTEQLTVLGEPELALFLKAATAACEMKEKADADAALDKYFGVKNENVKALVHAAGLSAALFGRMVTSDILARGDAAVHVAHAITVHAAQVESDYFTAVDELQADSDLGSAHINSTELTSGLYYHYVVVDLELLRKNLGNVEGLDAQVIEKLVTIIATVSPGAKKGSTAPYAYPHLVLVERGSEQPRTLANAFLKPVDLRGDLVLNASVALRDHLSELDKMYGGDIERRLCAIGSSAEAFGSLGGGAMPLKTVAAFAAGSSGSGAVA